MNDKKIAAFFDIDGTLHRDSLMNEHFKKLIKYEVVDERFWVNGVKDSYINWDKRFEDYDNYLFDVSAAYVKAITGLHKKYIDFATEQVMKLKADRVYKYTRNIIEKHKKEGHLIIFISGSPDFLVEAMGKKHHAFLAIGSKYIMKNNINNIIYLKNVYYNYYQTDGSITNNTNKIIKNIEKYVRDLTAYLKDRLEDIEEVEDAAFLCSLIEAVYPALSAPKKKK